MYKRSFFLILILLTFFCQLKAQQISRAGTPAIAHLDLTSSAFQNGAAIPKRFTCQGSNVSPGLAWTGVTAKIKSLALVCEDPDAPNGTFVHWVIYNISPTEQGLAGSFPTIDPLPNGVRQGKNGADKVGYMGPCPPAGKIHHYHFTLYGLNEKLSLTGEVDRDRLISIINGHIIAEGELIGTYIRQ